MKDHGDKKLRSGCNLAFLLIEWNEGSTSLSAEGCGRLLGLAETQLGLEASIHVSRYNDVTELAAAIIDHLPRAEGKTLADVYIELRTYLTEYGRVRTEKLKWDASWGSLVPRRWWDLTSYLDDLWEGLSDNMPIDFSDPHLYIGETVRSLWKSNGGAPFWLTTAYEEHWCAGQLVFYDMKELPVIREKINPASAEDRVFTPSTPVRRLMSRNESIRMLHQIESRFGAWVGCERREKWWWVLVAALLFTFPGMLAAFGVAALVTSDQDARMLTAIILWFLGISYAVYLYVASQPRLRPETVTVKDVVKTILKHRSATHPPRHRPILDRR